MGERFNFDDFVDYDGQANLPQPVQADLSQPSAEFITRNALDYTLGNFDAQCTMAFDTLPESTAQTASSGRVVAFQEFSLMDNASGGSKPLPDGPHGFIGFQPMELPLAVSHACVDGHG